MNDKKRGIPLEVSMPAWGVAIAESVHAATFEMEPRQDPFHKVLFVQAGESSFHAGLRRVVLLQTGSFMPVTAGESHWLQDTLPATIWLLCLDRKRTARDSLLSALWAQFEARMHLPILPEPAANFELSRHWRRMMVAQAQLFSERNPVTEALFFSELLRSLALLVRVPDALHESGAVESIRSFVGQLQEQFCENWSLDDAARVVGLSRRRFSELFKRLTGQTFLTYLTELRLLHAERMLNSHAHSVIAVAFACGFQDVSHFYRLFKMRFGTPPGVYRQTRRIPNNRPT